MDQRSYDHDLVERQGQYACRVCRWRWIVTPTDGCPGVRRYTWPTIPGHLNTSAQLRRAGIEDLGATPPSGCVWSDHLEAMIWLYDRHAIRPSVTPPAAHPIPATSRPARWVPADLLARDLGAGATPTPPAASLPGEASQAPASPARCTRCGSPERWMVTITDGVCDICRRQHARAAAGPAQQRGSTSRTSQPAPAGGRPPLTRISQPGTRHEIQAWARRLIAQGTGWVVLDTETTGTHGTAEIVDIAIVSPSGAVLLESLVRPTGSIQPAAAQVHGLSSAQLRNAPSFLDLYPRLQETLADQVVLAFNCPFDGRILNFCCVQAGLPVLAVSWGCVMQAFKGYAPGRSYNLRAACAHFGVTPGTHRATADALATLRVLCGIAGVSLADDAAGARDC